jgi:hypothetical protein
MRAVGLGLIVVAWASALTSEAQQITDTRAYIQVAAAGVCLVLAHALTRMPPSWTGADLLKPLERDIRTLAQERARGDAAAQAEYVALMRALVIDRIRGGANVPRDRRAWLRALSRLAEVDETGDDLEVRESRDTQPYQEHRRRG